MTLQPINSQNYRASIIRELGIEVFHFIEQYVFVDEKSISILLDTSSHTNFKSLQGYNGIFYRALDNVTNITKLNDVRFINKFLEESNEALSHDGLFIGHIEALHSRKARILRKYPRPFNWITYFLDVIIKRIFPKFRPTKKIYFFLTKGRNRVVSEMEIYGRLYSCGFELVDSKEINGMLWFVGRKIATPVFNTEATYGPLIKMKRHGKGNELFKVYKLRTMYPFSEYLQSYISAKHGLQKGGKFKNDPRITTAGRIFRKFWLDELPMCYNVLRGEMKIVGVRPLSSHYLSLYPDHIKELRAKVKPGLIPPFYADLPSTLDEITKSEEAYLSAYLLSPLYTDLKYLLKALFNIFIKRARSK
jgi:lipopolysaccharide/colanic/teichoic acid biosynthesis glycosyltransferase